MANLREEYHVNYDSKSDEIYIIFQIYSVDNMGRMDFEQSALTEEVLKIKHDYLIFGQYVEEARSKIIEAGLPYNVVTKLLDKIQAVKGMKARAEEARIERAEHGQPYNRVARALGINARESTELIAGLSLVDQIGLAEELEGIGLPDITTDMGEPEHD